MKPRNVPVLPDGISAEIPAAVNALSCSGLIFDEAKTPEARRFAAMISFASAPDSRAAIAEAFMMLFSFAGSRFFMSWVRVATRAAYLVVFLMSRSRPEDEFKIVSVTAFALLSGIPALITSVKASSIFSGARPYLIAEASPHDLRISWTWAFDIPPKVSMLISAVSVRMRVDIADLAA